MANFLRPTDLLLNKNRFSGTEVGLTHQLNPSFIRLCDNGDIEIMAAEGIGMVFHVANKSVTIVADSIKMITRDDGLRWNDSHFNSNGSQWTEPALLKKDISEIHGVFDGIEDFMDGQ